MESIKLFIAADFSFPDYRTPELWDITDRRRADSFLKQSILAIKKKHAARIFSTMSMVAG